MAIAGASRDKLSFSGQVATQLNKLGYKLWSVNPNFEQNEEDNYRVQTIEKLPAEVNHLLVLTPASQTEKIVEQAITKGIKNIWIQQKSETPAAIELAIKNGINLIHHHCIFMFAQPEGIHKFHYTLKKFFGGIPK
jgi:predicted CoA-binding protein